MSSASRKLIQASGAVAGAADTGDDDFANVVLLLDGDGTSGDDNNTFTDSSTNAHTITKNGSVVQGSFSPYGDNWSNYFGTAQSVVASDSAIAMGSGDWTLEFWVYFNAVNNGTVKYLFDWRTGSDTSNSFLAQETNNSWTYWNGSGSGITSGLTSSTFSVGTWHHVALSRDGSTLRFFVDGTNVGSPTDSTTYDSSTITIGNRYTGSYGFDGYISNVRIVKGTALYTSAFTPPTDPLTAVTNTELLTCSSNRFADESTNNSTITINGDPKVTPFSPFKDDDARDITTDGGSGYFDGGSGDVLVVATDTTLDITGDFTIECWYYNRNTGLYATLFGSSSGSSGSETKIMFDLGTGEINFQYQGGNIGATGGKNSEWNHIAVTRSGSTTRLFLNGNLEAHTNSSYTFTTGQKWVVGNRPPNAPSLNYPFTGFVSDARCIKGTALYISNFTPPTSPLTAITNTSLLLNFQDAGIYDRTGINNIDTVGNAQIDTAVKKYGTGSMEFDGTGDHCLLPASEELAMGAGDFTIEMWVNLSAVGSNDGVFVELRSSGATSNGFVFNARRVTSPSAGFKLNFYTDGGSNTASTILAYNTWHHVAVTRSSGTIRMFANGVSDITPFTKNNNFSDTPDVTIGQSLLYSPSNITGYVDDLRITKGIARYTSNFTAPDAALPKF